MTDHEEAELPDTGAVLTFGRSRFNENQASRFWIKSDPIITCSCGDEHTVVIAESRRVFAFGSNEFGQLGLGHTKSVTRPSCVKALKSEDCRVVGCGKSHTVVGTDDGKLFAFGLNQDGQLGLGHTEATFDQVTAWSGGRAVQLDAGVAHTAALTADGRLFAWGSNEDGQCGLGDAPGACLPTPVPSNDEIVNLSCGYHHTAFVSAGGDLYTFGENDEGQLGLGDRESRTLPTLVPKLRNIAKVACGGQHTVALTESGEVWCFGGGRQGQLGLGSRLLTVLIPHILILGPIRARDVATGHCHSAIITDDHQLLTFGDSRHGKLCTGVEESDVFVPQPATQLQKLQVNRAVLGGCHSMVLVEKLTSPAVRQRAQSPITDALPPSSDDLHSSARQRRREREMALPGRRQTLPPLKGASRPYQSPSEHENDIQPSSGRMPAADSCEPQSVQPPAEQNDHQSMSSSHEAQEDEAHDDEEVKTNKKKEGSTLSRLFNKFKRKKSETTEKEKEDEKETEKDQPEDETQPEGLTHRVLPVESAEVEAEEDQPTNPFLASDQQPTATADTSPPPPADTTTPDQQQSADEQKTPEEQAKKKKKKKAMSKTCAII